MEGQRPSTILGDYVLPTMASGTVSHLDTYQCLLYVLTMHPYTKARPTTQMTDALIPWATRASVMTQNVGASMSMICEPMSAT